MRLPILVTGAAGFVGAHLLPTLRRVSRGRRSRPASFDVTRRGGDPRRVAGRPPDACVHLAAISAIPAAQSDPDAAWRVNLGGTLTLARACWPEAPACTLLFVSTSDAYGRSFQRGVPLDETRRSRP